MSLEAASPSSALADQGRREVVRTGSLRPIVHGLGLVAALGHVSLTLSSYGQAAALWRTVPAPRAQALFDSWAAHVEPLWPWAAQQLAAGHWARDNVALLTGYCLQLAVPSAIFIALLLVLRARRRYADAATFIAVRRWAIAFAVIAAPAYPVYTQDFWLSVLWGRMIAAGDNPFHRAFGELDIAGLPLDHFPMTMSYGPLWGLFCAALTWGIGDRLLWSFVAFKLVLLAAWLGCLACVADLTRDRRPDQRCLSMAVIGWAPLGIGQSLAEGHNDVVMVTLLLAWLALLARRHPRAPLALAGATLVKYASAPLALVELVYLVRLEHGARRRLVRVLVPGVAVLVVMAAFFRSPAFFDGLRLINAWHFLRPRDAVEALGRLTGLAVAPLSFAVMLLFALVAARRFATSLSDATTESLISLSIGVMAAVVFTLIGHVWPWYLVWVLGLAALRPEEWLARFIVGVSIAAPFTLVFWWMEPLAAQRDLAALCLYGFGVLWAAMTAAGVATAPATSDALASLEGRTNG